jgi:ubiquinone/menaquinone biosynthesis C-methylase UbiE
MKILSAFLTTFFCAAIVANAQTPANSQVTGDDFVYFNEKQTVVINDFRANGPILDIGGGGIGLIGQMKGKQVIAIDIDKRELENAPDGPLFKIVMDATDLKFLDKSFDAATVFYTFMYIPAEKHEKVFAELFRVLKPGSILRIWDVDLPTGCDDPKKTTVVYSFEFKTPKNTIKTGYGVKWADKEQQNLVYYMRLSQKAGFKIVTQSFTAPSLYLELQKP